MGRLRFQRRARVAHSHSSLLLSLLYYGIVIAINVFDPSTHRTLGSSIASASNQSLTSNVATITTSAAHGLVVGDFVEITGFTSTLAPLNGTWRITTVPSTTTFTFALTGANITAVVSMTGAIKKITYDPTLVTNGDIIGGVNGSGDRYGLSAFKDAQALFNFGAKILTVPSFSTQNAVAVEMIAIAEATRAIAVIDAPAGLTVQQVLTGRGIGGSINFNTSSARAVLCYPHVKVYDTATESTVLEPYSPWYAGVLAAKDEAEGYHVSPSNTEIKGIVDTERPLTSMLNDSTSEANILNEAGITTLYRGFGTGIRTWGNRSAAFPQNTLPVNFVNIRRTADVIHESVEFAMLQFLDRPLNRALIDSITESVNAFIRVLIGRGALVDGFCFFNPDKNPVIELAAGHLTLDIEFMPPAPAERITFESFINIALLKAIQ